ncbi:MAG: FKBP-type peptidyl-prolyl cis-trans isomerase [Candidatus Methanomethylicaceae archaeon]|nr:FKBP-type peptidyl-prolyl cis-trans isomerase [Candidatus Verstraetearchaeota archaeon]
MPIKNGDFILLDYVLKIKDTGEIFDTTIEEEAKNANIHNPENTYEPRLVVVGQGWVIKGIEEALIDMEEGGEKLIEIPPEKAFGERDPSKVRIIPAKELTKQGITPRPGARIELGGAIAIIRSVGSGRVTIDFNHPLSGRTIIAKIIVRKILTDTIEKIRELIHMRIRGIPKEKFIISLIGNMISIEMPEETFMSEDIRFAKKGIVKDISKFFSDITSVQFIETHNIKTTQ